MLMRLPEVVTKGVLLSNEAHEKLASLRERSARGDAVASAWGSVNAEGLTPTGDFARDAAEFTEGAIDVDELLRRAIARHRR